MKAGEDNWKRGAAYPIPYLGSKRRLVRWIMESIPQDAKTVFDAFSGSGVVAYALKRAGFRVIANDRLRYCHHISRAIIENDTVRLTDDEIDALIADNPRADTFVQDHFDGMFFEPGVHRLIDMIRANVDRFSGYKRDIALAALGRACVTGKKGFLPHFHSTPAHTPGDTPERFRARVAETARCLNAMVIDTGARCEAHRADIMDILPRVKADLAYFDPPYATEFSSTNYEKDNHFVEGLMTYWDGLKIRMNTMGRYYETDHATVTKTNCHAFFSSLLSRSTHIPRWRISYRDRAYPRAHEIMSMAEALGMRATFKDTPHTYTLWGKQGENSRAREILIMCDRVDSEHSAGDTPAYGDAPAH